MPGFTDRAWPAAPASEGCEPTLPESPACEDPSPEDCAVCDAEVCAPVGPPPLDDPGVSDEGVLSGAGAVEGRIKDEAADDTVAGDAGSIDDVMM